MQRLDSSIGFLFYINSFLTEGVGTVAKGRIIIRITINRIAKFSNDSHRTYHTVIYMYRAKDTEISE
ncbi:hypothetical protein GWI33_004481 [Rhynchophorus ferrugineus]|uniref:Uncharacterized protein n=1 Tax=Rhynchophorus ferrugineus TaxID=354439 RepID=A0A834IIT1_RHYFE|nr:hypothetical protein GWI33_004481 [Rhynchophorus ferrugineus]